MNRKMQVFSKKIFLYLFFIFASGFLYFLNIEFSHQANLNDIMKLKNNPVIFLIRHGERCDSSENQCLGDKKGITIKGAKDAFLYGEFFSKKFHEKKYNVYSSDTVRTVQTAEYFSGMRPVIIGYLYKCDKSIYKKIDNLIKDKEKEKKKGESNFFVIFTHQHCLSFIANDMGGYKFHPDYLGTLVMHKNNEKFYLDGELKFHPLS